MAPGAHTHQRPRPPPPPGLPPPRQDSSERLREPGRRGGRPRGLVAGLALTHRLRQRPPAPANTPLSPQVGANQFCLLSLLLPGTPQGAVVGRHSELSALATKEGQGQGRNPASGGGRSNFSPLGLEVPSALTTWVASCRAQQAPPGQEAGLLQCVQEFKPSGPLADSSKCLQGAVAVDPAPAPSPGPESPRGQAPDAGCPQISQRDWY